MPANYTRPPPYNVPSESTSNPYSLAPTQQPQPQEQQQQQWRGGPPQVRPPQTFANSQGTALDNEYFIQTAYPAAQISLQLGSQALSAGQDYVNKNIIRYIPYETLKIYFNVTNTYVLRKLALILFPFRNKMWQRAVRRDAMGQIVGFQPPREDLNSPDLYIPAMAAVTYILLVGVVLGLRRAFHPEQLGITASAAIIFIACELLLVKFGAYILSLGHDVSILDVLSIIGYNFVPLICTLLAALFFGRLGKYLAFSYCSLAMAFFMLRSLRHSFLPDSSASALVVHQRRTRVHFLFGIVAIQILCSYFLLV